MDSNNSGLGYSRLKEKNFPFDQQKGGDVKNKELYVCKGCGHEVKADPRDVPTKCSKCNCEFSFFKAEKVAA